MSFDAHFTPPELQYFQAGFLPGTAGGGGGGLVSTKGGICWPRKGKLFRSIPYSAVISVKKGQLGTNILDSEFSPLNIPGGNPYIYPRSPP